VETLVAIAILMIAIVVPVYGIQKALEASYVSRDQLIASSLAEEGAEYIYFIRNNNYLYYSRNGSYPDSRGWLSRLGSCISTVNANGCAVDPAQDSITSCTASGCAVLRLNSSKLYTQVVSGNTATRFTRTVKITPIGATAARVAVTVSWSTDHRDYTVTVTDVLYNWL
jgi:Tfp pilus assembly protein PilV